jgi:hypothetical protein
LPTIAILPKNSEGCPKMQALAPKGTNAKVVAQCVAVPHYRSMPGKPRKRPSPSPAPAPKQLWGDRWRGFIRAGETAVVVGLLTVAATAGDMITVAVFSILAFIVSVGAIVIEPTISAHQKIVYVALVSIGISGSGAFAYWRHQEPISGPLLASQIDELKKLSRFFNENTDAAPGNNEENLRRLFDFHAMLANNVWFAVRNIRPLDVPPERSAAIDSYFIGAVGLINLDYMSVGTKQNGAYVFSTVPGKIGTLKLPKTYLDSKQKLLDFETSIQLPSAIRASLKDLDKVIDDNVNLLFLVMNEQLSRNPNYLLGDQDSDGPYLGATTNLYWKRFVPLKPKVDKILDEIRSYLKLEK